jgi:hypothetical protein
VYTVESKSIMQPYFQCQSRESAMHVHNHLKLPCLVLNSSAQIQMSKVVLLSV